MALKDRINELFEANPEKKNNHLALYIGCSRSTVTDWRNGKTSAISGAFAYKVGEFFNVRPKWVQTGLGKKELQSDGVRDIVRVSIPLEAESHMSPKLIRTMSGIDDPDLIVAIYNLISIKRSSNPDEVIRQTIELLENHLESAPQNTKSPLSSNAN